MPSIAAMIRDLQGQLARAGIESPRLDAELLLGHALGLTRSQLLARMQDEVDPISIGAASEFVQRRIEGESVAYILGRRDFYGLTFAVGPDVLTPRPETELLVEWALAWLRDRPAARVVDVGTGSGAIAIAIASATPETVHITAVDCSDAALIVARDNAGRLVPGRVDLRSGNLLANEPGLFDLILANLPYLRADQIDGNRDLVAEPRIALDGGIGGLELIDRLIRQLPTVLAPGGASALEIDPSQAQPVRNLLEIALPAAQITVHRDLAGLDRFITAVRI